MTVPDSFPGFLLEDTHQSICHRQPCGFTTAEALCFSMLDNCVKTLARLRKSEAVAALQKSGLFVANASRPAS